MGSQLCLHDMHMKNLYNVDTWHKWFQKRFQRSGCHVLDHTCRNHKLVRKCWYSSRGAGRSAGVRCVTGRIRSLDVNFSFQLSEKTFGPNRVHVPKDVESGVQREEFFAIRLLTKPLRRHRRAACSRPLKSVPVEQTRGLRECPWSPHTREYPSGHEKNMCQKSYNVAVPNKEKRPYKTSP